MALPSGLTKKTAGLGAAWRKWRLPLIVVGVAIVALSGGKVALDQIMASSAQAAREALESNNKAAAKGVGTALSSATTKLVKPLGLAALATLVANGDAAAIQAQEAAITDSSPQILKARLLPKGYSTADYSAKPPMSYASLDMLKRSDKAKQAPPIEVHLLKEPERHLVALRQLKVGNELVGHLHLALDAKLLNSSVKKATQEEGYLEVTQGNTGGKPLVVGRHGDQGAKQGPPMFTAKVPGTILRVSSWPKAASLPSGGDDSSMLLVGGIVLLILVLGGVGFVVFRKRGGAKAEKQTAEVAAETDGGDPLAAKLAALKAADPSSITPIDDPDSGIQVDDGDAGLAVPAGDAAADAPPPAPAAAAAPSGGKTELPESIFRAYDIRGIVGDTLTAEIVHEIGRAIGSEAHDRGQQTVVVGCDGRDSGPELMSALAAGLRAAGRDVIDIGRVPTPVLYYATHYLNTGSGVMVTGSHNPPEYNGLKIMLGGDTLSGEEISALRTRVVEGNLETGQGTLQSVEVVDEYVRRISEEIPVALGNSFKVVIDCGNGIAGAVAPKLIRALGHDVVELFCEVDGSFPNHHPDPSQPENLADLVAAMAEHEADIGFAFDGDGDRLGVVDSKGNIIWPDRQMMLYAIDVLSRNAGAEIVFDVKCSSRLAKVIKAKGGKPVMWKTGHSFIKKKLKESGAPLAGEMSGHIFFNDRWYGFDDALYTASRMLEILMGLKPKPHEIFAKLPAGKSTPELKVDMQEGQQFEFIEKLVAGNHFADGKASTIDGLRVDFRDGWGLVRASNTTPCLVLRFEGDNDAALSRIQEEFRAVILGLDSGLQLPF